MKAVNMMSLNMGKDNMMSLDVARRVLNRLETLGEHGLHHLVALAQSAALRDGEYRVLEGILSYLPQSPYSRLLAKDCRTARRFSVKAKIG